MQEVALINDVKTANALMHPLRIALLRGLAEPSTCTVLARALEQTPQKVNYHVRLMEEAGLIERVDERRVRGIVEGIYQARARSFWLAPDLVGRVGDHGSAAERTSLGFLLDLSEHLRGDIGVLSERLAAGQEVHSMGVRAQVLLRDAADRGAFRAELEDAIKSLARKYGASTDADADAETYEVLFACYPQATPPHD